MKAIKLNAVIMKKTFFFQNLICAALLVFSSLTVATAQDYEEYDGEPRPSSKVRIQYNAWLQGTGEFGWETQPHLCGTEGENRRLEAFIIQHANGSKDRIAIECKVYLQDLGWQGWTLMPDWVGTKGQKRRLEAFRIKVVDKPSQYSIYYKAHLAGTGWTDWVKDGQMCGTTQQQRAVQAIKIMVVDRINDDD